ncbi:MAG: hypothetical protein RL750_199, partial [Bacteroidota bacterium]
RGCQTSIFFETGGRIIFNELEHAGVITDWRDPGVIRVAPVPLYNRFQDIADLIIHLDRALKN